MTANVDIRDRMQGQVFADYDVSGFLLRCLAVALFCTVVAIGIGRAAPSFSPATQAASEVAALMGP